MTNQPPRRTGLLELLRNSVGSQFVIPVYQRNYTWTANKEVKQYIDDLCAVLENKYDKYLRKLSDNNSFDDISIVFVNIL